MSASASAGALIFSRFPALSRGCCRQPAAALRRPKLPTEQISEPSYPWGDVLFTPFPFYVFVSGVFPWSLSASPSGLSSGWDLPGKGVSSILTTSLP